MKLRRGQIVVLVIVAVVGVMVLRSVFSREPAYRGKKVGAWFKQYYRTGQWSSAKNERRHEEASRAIVALGTNAVPFLVRECFSASRDFSPKTNVQAFLASWRGPVRFPPFVPADMVRQEAADALLKIRPPANLLLPLVTNRLNDPDQVRQRMAVYLLGTVGQGAEAAVPLLRGKFQSEDFQQRVLAVFGLDRLGAAAWPVTADLIEVVRTNGGGPAYYAMRALAKIGPSASNAIPVLKEKFIAQTNLTEQAGIAGALICIDPSSKLAPEFLERRRMYGGPDGVLPLLFFLSEMGTNARTTLPMLKTILRDPDTVASKVALEAVYHLGETNLAIGTAVEWLKSDKGPTRFNALTFMLRVQPTHELVMSNLVTELNEMMWGVEVVNEAARLGALSKPLIPRLRDMATSETNPYRQAAREALEIIEADIAAKEMGR